MERLVRYTLRHTIPPTEDAERARVLAQQREYDWLLDRLHQEQRTQQQYDAWHDPREWDG